MRDLDRSGVCVGSGPERLAISEAHPASGRRPARDADSPAQFPELASGVLAIINEADPK